MSRNFEVPKDMEFNTVWISTDCEFAKTNQDANFIDYKTDDLADFLTKI